MKGKSVCVCVCVISKTYQFPSVFWIKTILIWVKIITERNSEKNQEKHFDNLKKKRDNTHLILVIVKLVLIAIHENLLSLHTHAQS